MHRHICSCRLPICRLWDCRRLRREQLEWRGKLQNPTIARISCWGCQEIHKYKNIKSSFFSAMRNWDWRILLWSIGIRGPRNSLLSQFLGLYCVSIYDRCRSDRCWRKYVLYLLIYYWALPYKMVVWVKEANDVVITLPMDT